MKPTITWIVIADGTQAKVFEHDGPGKGLRALKDLSLDQQPLKARDIVADREGRSFSSVGPGRSAYRPNTDPVDYREAQFVGRVAEVLEGKLRDGAFHRLIIAADPTSLGNIRKMLSKPLQEVIMAEMPKDLTNVPVNKLAQHFEGVLAV